MSDFRKRASRLTLPAAWLAVGLAAGVARGQAASVEAGAAVPAAAGALVELRSGGGLEEFRVADLSGASSPAWFVGRRGKAGQLLSPEGGYAVTNRVIVRSARLEPGLTALARGRGGDVWPLRGVDGYWVLTARNVGEAIELAELAAAVPGVESAELGLARPKALRTVPGDVGFANQWHLHNTLDPLFDANLEPAWDRGYSGAGQVIGIIDAGVQITHTDLSANFNAAASQVFATGPTVSHGTSVAGVAAAVANNGLLGVGSAFGAQFSELRIGTDEQDAAALGFRHDLHDIKNNSWGPPDNASAHVLPAFVLDAVAQGVRDGRGGKGTIFVWAGGNGDRNGDRVDYDPLASSRYVVPVGAIGDLDEHPDYSERGSALLLVAPSDGNARAIYTTSLNNGFTNSFGGTSAAAPLVSGVAALMLEANPGLTWRDVQMILADSARQCDPTDAGWIQNGAGRLVNYLYGYGAVDAGAAVALAETWERLPHELALDTGVVPVNVVLPDGPAAGRTMEVDVPEDVRIESVELILNVTTDYIGDLNITVTSPAGTPSILARKRVDGRRNYVNYRFTSRRFLGELAGGTWKVQVADNQSGDVATWQDFRLVIWGTAACPGDLDASGGLELNDLLVALAGFGPCEAEAGFDPALDLDNSGCNDVADVLYLLERFGTACE